jgi:hypothetical protein
MNQPATTPAHPAPRKAGTGANDRNRCQHRTPSGRQCRSSRSGTASALCTRHGNIEKHRRSADLTANLTVGRDTFLSAEAINRSLAELYTLLARNRVSPRRAAVLAYIGSLLLRTLSPIKQEQSSRDQARNKDEPPVKFIWDIPAPQYERDLPPGNPRP